MPRPEGIQYGFTAQNIQSVYPEKVSVDAQSFLQTAYGTYDAMFVESIRALLLRIERLEHENQSLKTQLGHLPAQFNQMKAELQALSEALAQEATAKR